jgi:hypothetical protein
MEAETEVVVETVNDENDKKWWNGGNDEGSGR